MHVLGPSALTPAHTSLLPGLQRKRDGNHTSSPVSRLYSHGTDGWTREGTLIRSFWVHRRTAKSGGYVYSLHAGASLLHASSIRIPCGCVTMRANGEFSSDCNILREMASGVAFTLTGMVSTSQSVTSDW